MHLHLSHLSSFYSSSVILRHCSSLEVKFLICLLSMISSALKILFVCLLALYYLHSPALSVLEGRISIEVKDLVSEVRLLRLDP